MDRRTFLKTGTVAAANIAILGCSDVIKPTKAPKSWDLGAEKCRIGILSDIHILNLPGNSDTFRHALQYFNEAGVDGVLIAGDLADCGQLTELNIIGNIWREVFPDNKGSDGRHVEKLFIYGNHDLLGPTASWAPGKYGGAIADMTADALNKNKAAAWKEAFDEDYSDIYIKEVKGYKFIGAHFNSYKSVDGLAAFLTKQNLGTTKPFFYFQHPHPKGTCSAPWTWGQDDGTVTQILSAYPNCVAFSGHSHSSLTDERTIWQGTFTSVGCGSLSYIIPFGGRENSVVFSSGEKLPAQMPTINCKDGRQGMIMSIHEGGISIERREFVYDEVLCSKWVCPVPVGNAPMSFEKREIESVAPEFGKNSQVTVTTQNGTDRYGVAQKQYVVKFPTAKGENGGVRAFDYEVSVEIHDVDTYKKTCTKRVYSPGYFRGVEHDSEDATCLFGDGEINTIRLFRFVVRPCECFGKMGAPIYSDWMGK